MELKVFDMPSWGKLKFKKGPSAPGFFLPAFLAVGSKRTDMSHFVTFHHTSSHNGMDRHILGRVIFKHIGANWW